MYHPVGVRDKDANGVPHHSPGFNPGIPASKSHSTQHPNGVPHHNPESKYKNLQRFDKGLDLHHKYF